MGPPSLIPPCCVHLFSCAHIAAKRAELEAQLVPVISALRARTPELCSLLDAAANAGAIKGYVTCMVSARRFPHSSGCPKSHAALRSARWHGALATGAWGPLSHLRVRSCPSEQESEGKDLCMCGLLVRSQDLATVLRTLLTDGNRTTVSISQ